MPLERRVDLDVSLDFGQGIYIGGLEGNAVEAWTRSEDKLAIQFPLRMASPRVTADAPFDVYEPEKEDFQSLGWVELADSDRGASVTLVNDRATAYLVQKATGGTDIRAVLAYGGPFEYAPDKAAPLRGKAGLSDLTGFRRCGLDIGGRLGDKGADLGRPSVPGSADAAGSGHGRRGALPRLDLHNGRGGEPGGGVH